MVNKHLYYNNVHRYVDISSIFSIAKWRINDSTIFNRQPSETPLEPICVYITFHLNESFDESQGKNQL